MFLKQDSSFTLQAQLNSVVNSSQVEISLTYKDNTNNDYSDVIVTTNNTTAITLLAAPPANTVNIVELIKIYNPDIKANTVEILANNVVIYTCTIGAKESVMLSKEFSSNGLGFTPLAIDGDGSNLTGITTAQIADTVDKRFVTDTEKTNYNTAYNEAHTHSNKTLLDNLISSGDGNSYLANDGSYKSINNDGLLQVEDLGITTSNFSLELNKTNIAVITASLTISLPTTGFINGVENKCVLNFTTTSASSPTIYTTGTLRWSNRNSGIAPSSFSTITGVRNVLTFTTYDAGATWEAEYTTFGGLETAFLQPTLTSNGTIGGSSFAVLASSENSANEVAYKMCDGSSSTWWSATYYDTSNEYIIIYNPIPIKISSMTLSNNGIGAWTLYGSNDNSNWTTLSSGTNSDINLCTVSIAEENRRFYKYYKLFFTSPYIRNVSYFAYELAINATYVYTN